MRRWSTAAAAALILMALPAWAADIYSVRFDDGGALKSLETSGARVRHIGDGVALVEWDGDGAPRVLSDLHAERLAAPESGEHLYACYPASSATALSPYGRVLYAESGGAVLMAVRDERLAALRSACFHVHELPASIDVAGWFDDAPPAVVASRTPESELAVRGVVEDVMSSVSVDSLMAYVKRLSEYQNGSLRSRYVLRDECLTEGKSYIVDKLESYLPAGAVVDSQRFHVLGYSCDEDTLVVSYPADNIVGTLPGSGRLQGYYIVCAHYDAIASHSFPGETMWWCDNPAPGADDNATGVAVVLEAARVLSGLSFPFDVRFILWSGEELGLLGSRAYADSVAAEGDTIYGVLNVDMIAYKPESSAPDTCHIVTNTGSKWLADWIVDTAGLYPEQFDDFHISRIDRALAYSDHGSFWFKGYDGIIAIEHWNPRDRNPYYHTTGDTLGNITPSQFDGVGRAVAGSVARLAETDGTFNLAVFPEDLSSDPPRPDVGDIVHCDVKVHAFGPDESVDMTLKVYDGDPETGELLETYAVSRTMGGGEVFYHRFTWLPGEADLGLHEFTAVVEADGVEELTTTDNEAVFEVRVNDPENLFVMNHYVYPNPSGASGDPAFRYELSKEGAAVRIRLFDITGQELGTFQRGLGEGNPGDEIGISAGWNTVLSEEFEGPAAGLASGVYIYRLSIYAEGASEPADEVSGRFAVVR